jgi:hypothetical protein
MSVITIQIGQAGNQIGYSFFEQLSRELKESSPFIQERIVDTYFQRDFENDCLIANSILIDMEPKVV